MVSLSENEQKVINFLVRNFTEKYNINQIAKKLKLSPRGSYKILYKLESQAVLKSENLGNAIFYQLDYSKPLAIQLARLVLIEREIKPRIKVIIEDLEPLKVVTKCAVLFGSILETAKANDIDLLLVLEKSRFSDMQKITDQINKISPKKIHSIIQTKSDLLNNIKKRDKIVIDVIKKGMILWGEDLIVDCIRNG